MAQRFLTRLQTLDSGDSLFGGRQFTGATKLWGFNVFLTPSVNIAVACDPLPRNENRMVEDQIMGNLATQGRDMSVEFFVRGLGLCARRAGRAL